MNFKKLVILIIVISLSFKKTILSQASILTDLELKEARDPTTSLVIMVLLVVGFFGWNFWKAHEDIKKGK